MNLIITQELAQKILNYLTEKPFKEVFQLVNELSQLKKVEEKEGK